MNRASFRWLSLDFANPSTASETTATITALAEQAIAEAIQLHRTSGAPIYFRNRAGQLIKEYPSGRLVVVRLNADDLEEETDELPVQP